MLFSLAFEFPKTLDEFMGNTTLFFGSIGALVLIIAIIVICSCVSKSKKKKKNAVAVSSETVETPVAEVVTSPVVEAEINTTPVYGQPIAEPVVLEQTAPIDESFSYQPEDVAQPEAEYKDSLDLLDQIDDEPIVVAPVEEKPRKATKTKVIKNTASVEDDGGWETAKITVPAKKEDTTVLTPSEAPAIAQETKVAPIAPKAKATSKKKATPKPVVEATPVVEESEDDKPKVVGKYVISSTSDFHQYSLYANNGQLLYESRAYATLNSCKAGIETFKKNIVSCEYRIDVDKNGGYKYIFKKGNSIYIGESYRTAKAAENSAESVKRFALISNIVVE